MSKTKELNRRSMYYYGEGNYAVCLTAIDAEIVVEDKGQPIYLHAQWVDAVGEISYEANTKSVYDYDERYNNGDEDVEKLVEERDRVAEETKVDFEKYRDKYEDELKQMILDEMEAHDIDTSEYEDFEEIW